MDSAGIQHDVKLMAELPIIGELLNVICNTTGMGFTAVARVTSSEWVACNVLDNIGFGLKPGGSLPIKTTICSEIETSHNLVVIDDVDTDAEYHNHHTPAMYGFKSYISVPLFLPDGYFFGTLCAIDPNPNQLSATHIVQMFTAFANVIGYHYAAARHIGESSASAEAIRASFKTRIADKERELDEMTTRLTNKDIELQAFNFITSHDLQEPLRKIRVYISMLLTTEEKTGLSESAVKYLGRINDSASRLQVLIKDLLKYSDQTDISRKYEVVNLSSVINTVKADLVDEIEQKKAVIEVNEQHNITVLPTQFRQLLYNLLSNSIKFSHPGRTPFISITSEIGPGKKFFSQSLNKKDIYCHISVSDNGIGFEPRFNDKVFDIFQRLDDDVAAKGTGMGLTIVRKIIQNHNGIITATGKPGEGATFDIYVPVNQV